jgi:hypothetical protein
VAEIKFDRDYVGGRELARSLGRLQVGDYVVRLYLYPDGVIRMIIPANAKTDGSIIWSPARNDGVALYGFGATPEAAKEGK